MHLLVAEGDTTEAQTRLKGECGLTPGERYAHVLKSLAPQSRITLCSPAETGAALPDGVSLTDFDGIAITGSALHVYDMTEPVTRQIAFARAALSSGTPVFGSCWGLQVLACAAGGVVRRNPKGREIGIGRAITQRGAPGVHPLLKGRSGCYEALSVHMDEVETLPPRSHVLCSNAMSEVQALAFEDAPVWGVQYHPEFSFGEMAQIGRRIAETLVEDGHFADLAACQLWCDDLDCIERKADDSAALARLAIGPDVLELSQRRLELQNWITGLVQPVIAQRLRAA